MDLSKYYKHIAIGVSATILIVASYFGVKNFFLNKELKKRDAQLEILNTELNLLKGEKLVLKKQADDAVTSFETQKKRAETAEQKLAKLKPVVIPTTVTTTITAECIEQLQLVKREYDSRELVFTEVIKEQKETIAAADLAIGKLKDEIKVDDTIIAKHEEKDKVNDAKIDALEKKVESETSKKKIYRTSTAILGAVVLILLL